MVSINYKFPKEGIMDRMRNQEVVKGDNAIKSELHNELLQPSSSEIYFNNIKKYHIYAALYVLDTELEKNENNLKNASLEKHQILYKKNISRCEQSIRKIESLHDHFDSNEEYAKMLWLQMIAHDSHSRFQEVNTLAVNAIGKAISNERRLMDKGRRLLEEETSPYEDTTNAYKNRYISEHKDINHANEILPPDVPKSLVKGNPKDYIYMETWGYTYMNDKSIRSSEPFYENIFNPKEGIIIGRSNYKDVDTKWEGGKGSKPLYNTEILWNQYIHAAKKIAYREESARDEDFKVADFRHKYFDLKEYIGCEVTEPDTVAFLSSYIDENDTKIFTKDSDMYYAILGTKIGSRIVRLLKDHKEDFGDKIISDIEVKRAKSGPDESDSLAYIRYRLEDR